MLVTHAGFHVHGRGQCLAFSFLVCLMQTGNAQQQTDFGRDFDASKGVLFEDSRADSTHSAISPDGSVRVESEYRKIRIYSVEDKQLLHEFGTSDNTTAPRFNADGTKLFAAVCRGNLECASTIYQWDLRTGKSIRLGDCRGLVLDISTNTADDRVAAIASYGAIASVILFKQEGKWYGGEIVVFDIAAPDDKVRIFCELSEIPSPTDLLAEPASEESQLGENLQNTLEAANLKYLPRRVRLTPDGSKIIAVTSTGVVRVFDAQTGKPELLLSSHIKMDTGPVIRSEESK